MRLHVSGKQLTRRVFSQKMGRGRRLEYRKKVLHETVLMEEGERSSTQKILLAGCF